ncbi:hypothetical protein A9Q83_09650 [Alphaproteobacteria bacterium 46_93_T64]|nr:hypothetical protein A9Q83_09650 [Alphaproteobacteria bacterium 46_93_T64]
MGNRFDGSVDLLLLMRMLERPQGITLSKIIEEFDVGRRTAERMMSAVKRLASWQGVGHTASDYQNGAIYPTDVETDDGDGRKTQQAWRLDPDSLNSLKRESLFFGRVVNEENTIVALDAALRLLKKENQTSFVKDLMRLKEEILRSKSETVHSNIEYAAELLEFSTRPGPKKDTPPETLANLVRAISAWKEISFVYSDPWHGTTTRETFQPYGIINGEHHYIVGKVKGTDKIERRRMPKVSDLNVLETTFTKDGDFDLKKYADQSFGTYQEEPAIRVKWKILPKKKLGDPTTQFGSSPKGAEDAAAYKFHPTQKPLVLLEDGSVIVEFEAKGTIEMCWHLFTWGDRIEIIEPASLRETYSDLLSAALANHK